MQLPGGLESTDALLALVVLQLQRLLPQLRQLARDMRRVIAHLGVPEAPAPRRETSDGIPQVSPIESARTPRVEAKR